MPARGPQSHHGSHAGETSRVRAALRPRPRLATYPATQVVSCRGNWGGAPGFVETQIEQLGDLNVPLVATRTRACEKLMQAVPPPWSCA
jgi:hypothetical protein